MWLKHAAFGANHVGADRVLTSGLVFRRERQQVALDSELYQPGHRFVGRGDGARQLVVVDVEVFEPRG